MAIRKKQILLALPTQWERLLVMEIISQIDEEIIIDQIAVEGQIPWYLHRCSLQSLPGLIITESFPVQLARISLLEEIRKTPGCSGIPITAFTGSNDVQQAFRRVRDENVHFYSKPSRPSEWKVFLKTALPLCGIAPETNGLA